MKLTVALALAVLSLACFPAVSPAPVAPRDCGFITVGGQRLNVKADQMRCKKARKATRKYMNRKGGPAGFSCTRYSADQTSVAFRCVKGKSELFAIRR